MAGRLRRALAASALPLLVVAPLGAQGPLFDRPAGMPSKGQPFGAAPVTIRVLTYNIRHGEGTDRRLDLRRVARVIREANPDLVALQEVDQGTERVGGAHQLEDLAQILDMHGYFGKAMDFGGGQYGVGVLSRWPLDAPDNRPLPSSEHREPRTVLRVLVRAGHGGPVLRFASTHLDQSRESTDQASQAQSLNALFALEDDMPSILAGDFNARPGSEVMAVLDAHWVNPLALTEVATPSRGRRRGPRGDFVLFRPAQQWRVIEARTLEDRLASDHRPVLAVLEWIGTD